MKSTQEVWEGLKKNWKMEWQVAFLATAILGFMIHMPILISDIPNHDGLASMYFDQNMITSGRWFLMVACGFSSFYALPWLIGVLSICFLGLTSVVLVEVLEVRRKGCIVLISGLLISFPAIASTFAYVFTMDGYMLGMLLAVLAVLFTKKYKKGFLLGGICLAFSLGIYQAYLPFAVLLSIYCILIVFIEGDSIAEKRQTVLRYLSMGVIGLLVYYIVLRVLLLCQGKVLDTYQGINEMTGLGGILPSVKSMYVDFVQFTMKGKVLFQNPFSLLVMIGIVLFMLYTFVLMCIKHKWWKKVSFYVILCLLIGILPLATNLILLISPEVTYHLLMRYQWVILLIMMVAFIERYGFAHHELVAWVTYICVGVLVFSYGVTDNIAYSNLQKRYEKTYSYCIRLLDRIEQTEGYYQGIPIAMIGVVGDEPYPLTDITMPVTENMIGISGDSLLYTGYNYQAFIKHYLGATLNILPPEAMEEMYYSKEYREMDSFPGEQSIRIIDGTLYVKTENIEKN